MLTRVLAAPSEPLQRALIACLRDPICAVCRHPLEGTAIYRDPWVLCATCGQASGETAPPRCFVWWRPKSRAAVLQTLEDE